MSFDDLKDIFTSAGVNLFPEDDAFCYAEGSFYRRFDLTMVTLKVLVRAGTCEKHYVMESHLYDCMAAIALTHNFTWSRWNFMAGRRSCVLLMREIVENRKTVRFLIFCFPVASFQRIYFALIYSQAIPPYMLHLWKHPLSIVQMFRRASIRSQSKQWRFSFHEAMICNEVNYRPFIISVLRRFVSTIEGSFANRFTYETGTNGSITT